MLRLTWSCSRTRSWVITTKGPPTNKSSNNFRKTKEIFRGRLMRMIDFERRHTKNISKKRGKLMLLCNAWLKRITNRPKSTCKKRSNPRQIWFCPWMKRELSWSVRRKWKNMKMKWSADMLNNSRQEKMRSVPWRSRLKQLEIRSSRNLQLKKHNVVLKLNFKKIFETNFMFKRQKRLLKLRSGQKLKNVSEFGKNSKQLKNSKWNLRLKELKKRNVWRTNSSVSWWRNSQRMSA